MTINDWLSQLIAFDTTSRFSNLALIDCLANSFNDNGIRPVLIHDPKEPKANLLATLPDKRGGYEGGIILSGHTDVVPVDGQNWDSDPFKANWKEGRVYGRGTCDMKGFIAVSMSLIPQIKAMNLDFPVHFAFSYDEEIGCLGAPSMIAKMGELDYQPLACIVGEPTSMLPVTAHKGKRSYRCQIKGVAAHSSLTNQGCNAIEHAAAFISHLRQMALHFKTQGYQDPCYDVPYTTITTNLIQGGNAYNTIPAHSEFIFEFRNLACDNDDKLHADILDYVEKQLLPNLKEDHPNANVLLDLIAKAPGLETPVSEALVQVAQTLCQNTDIKKVAYATEAGMFQQAQIPTIVCGPGSIEQAHRANEYVEVEQLHLCEQFILSMLQASFLKKR